MLVLVCISELIEQLKTYQQVNWGVVKNTAPIEIYDDIWRRRGWYQTYQMYQIYERYLTKKRLVSNVSNVSKIFDEEEAGIKCIKCSLFENLAHTWVWRHFAKVAHMPLYMMSSANSLWRRGWYSHWNYQFCIQSILRLWA